MRRTLAFMLALIITGSALADYHISVRADEEESTSDFQAQTDVGTADGFIISPDFLEQTDTETEDDFTITFDPQEQADTETQDEFTIPFDPQEQTDTETEDESIMTLDSQDQIDAGAEGGLTITASEVKMNGNPLGDADYVYSGAEIEITLNWALDNETRVPDGTKFTSQEFVIDVSSLDLKGIELSNISKTPGVDLYFGEKRVGSYYLTDGQIHIVIEDEDFYQHEKGRHGGLTFKGIVEKDDDVKNDGKKKEVGIGDKSVLKDYYLTDTESSVSVSKSLSGDLDAKIINGETKYYQTYKVTVTAHNGTVHNINLSDTPSDGLTNPTDVRIAINRAGVSSPEEHTFNSLDEALAYIHAIDDLYMGESIDIYYTMEVSDHVFDQGVWGYDNTVSGQYTSNRSKDPEERKDTGTDNARVSVTRPEINKVGVSYEVRNGKGYVKWKITIKLNDLYDEDIANLQDYIDQVIDIPGDKFVKSAQEKLDLSQFTDEGGGVYTYEYELEVTEDVFNSVVNEQVSNKVQVKFKDIENPYDKVGSYTIENTGASIVKTLADYEKVNSPDEGMLLTWKIVVSNIPEGVKGFKIYDEARHYNNNPGNQELLTQIRLTDSLGHTNVLVVDETGNITTGGAGYIEKISYGTVGEGYGYSTIEFKDTYIEGIAKANGTITLEVQTLITEDTIGHEYGNGAKVSYQDPNTNSSWESAESRDIFRDTKSLLTKTGEVLVGKNAIEYTIKVMVPVLEITEPDKKFIITDEIPTGLSVNKDEIIVQLTDQWGNVRVESENVTYSCSLDEQKLTVNITATDNLIKQIKGYPEGEPDGYYLVVKFIATVEDQKAFLEKGETVKYTNSASGAYDGDSIGGDTVDNDLAPAQMVDKKGEYTQDSAPYAKYTVHVNRGGITLGVDPLMAVDTLGSGSALTFVNDVNHTVEVYEVHGSDDWSWAEKLDASEYSYEISEDKHTLTFTKLPDGKHLRIEYYAYVDFENVKTLDETNAGNNFKLKGFSSEQAEGGYQFTGDTFTPNGWVSSKVGSISLYKFWTNGDGMEALKGSVFQIRKMRIDNGVLVEDDTNGPVLIRDNIRITDENHKGEGTIEIDNLPINQILALVETEADERYSLGAPYYFVVDGTTTIDDDILQKYNIKSFKSGDTLEYENRLIEYAQIQIVKIFEESDTDMLTWEKIKDSLSFVIKKEQGEIFQTVQTLTGADLHIDESDGTIRYVSDIISVEPGTYRVVETKSTIPDFEVVTTYVIETKNGTTQGSLGTTGEIDIQNPDEVVSIVYTNTYSYTGTFPVKVSKRALTGTNEIEGARFRLGGGTLGTDVVFWTSGNVPYELELEPGEYTLTELQAPRGYKRATEEIRFTVDKSGKIKITQGSEEDNKAGNDTVVMRDEPLDVEVDKIAVVEGVTKDVGGAVLTLYDKNDLDEDYNLLPNKEPLYEWTSNAGESKQIGRYLYADDMRTYVLVETKVPENGGYGYSKKIEFKVRENGEIYDVKYVGGSTTGTGGTTDDAEVATEDTTSGTEGNKILMEDKVISVKLSKVDLQGNTIAGQATISVYRKDDIDEETGDPLPNAKAVDAFTFSNSSDPHEFGSKLQPGTEYVFVETGVPDGYKKADNISFKVEEDGTVTVYGGTEQKDGAYLMYDAKEDEVTASLVIYKTVSGELSLDQINGALKFHVKKISGEGDPYDETFTIAENFKKENGRYVLELNNLPLGTYKVTEIYEGTTPDGMKLEVSYTIDNNQKQTDSDPNNKDFVTGDIVFTTDNTQHTVTFDNDYQYKTGTIKLTKSLTFVGSALNWNNVAGKLKFHIYKVVDPNGRKEEIDGSPVSGSSLRWNDEKKVYEFEMQVPVGTYIVEEKYESIDGYVMTTTHKVNGEEDTASESVYITSKQAIGEDGTLEVGYNNRYVQICSVDISKRDITDGEELADVTWEITGTKWDGTSINPIQWTTKKDTATGEVKPHKVTLEPGEYTLTEITAPVGYKKADSITFEIDNNGDIIIISGQTNALAGSTVIMWDDPLDVEVDKVTLGGGEEVKGATLYLYDDKGNKLAEHVSDDKVWRIGEYLQLGKTYRLVEKLAPNGYGYSADIEFTVGDDGKIAGVKYSDSSDQVKRSDTKDGAVGSTQGNKILMEDRPISIKLNKVELGSITKELEGAVIAIYKEEDVDADGRLKNPDTEPLETWISKAGECHEFGTKLEAGHDYVFVETVAPNGYQVAVSIRFTIMKDGSVGNVSMVTEGTVKKTTDGGDTVYLMEDDVYTDPNAMLVLTKSIEGAGISSADLTKTNLRFRVESIGVDPAYDQVFYAGKDGFEWDGSKYVQYIYNLKPGKYKVTELWDDSAALGIACTGQTWEMVLNGDSGTRSTPGTGVTTGEFNLEDGGTTTVAYTNTYTANDNNQDNSNTEDSQESDNSQEDSPGSGKEDSPESGKEDSPESGKEDSQENGKENSHEDSKDNRKESSKSDSVDNTDVYDNDSPSVLGKMVKTVEDGLVKTGDMVPVGAWLLIMMLGVAGLGVGGYALMRRKEKDSLKISADELEEIKIK